MKRVSTIAVAVLLATAACTAPPAELPTTNAAPGATVPDGATSTLTVVAIGDLLVHPQLTEQAAADATAAGHAGHDFTQILASIAPIVRPADLAICHLETPLAPPEGPFTGWPMFSVPPELADAAKWAGFDTCSTASNHSLDGGVEGIDRTLSKLDSIGLKHAGTARTAEEAARINLLDVGGVTVAQLSYTFALNDIPLPEGRPWAANVLDVNAILAAARKAREQGAEIVILSVHWGTEYQNEPNGDQLDQARQLLASPDLDLIIGHHVHVVQPFEKIGNKWVAYGLGNLTARFDDGTAENTQDAVVPRFTFRRTGAGRWEVSTVEVYPTFMQYQPVERVVNLGAAISDPATPPEARANYVRIQNRILGYVNQNGANLPAAPVA